MGAPQLGLTMTRLTHSIVALSLCFGIAALPAPALAAPASAPPPGAATGPSAPAPVTATSTNTTSVPAGETTVTVEVNPPAPPNSASATPPPPTVTPQSVAPAPLPAPRPAPLPTRTGRPMMIAGISLLASTYVISSLSGALAADNGHTRWGRRMLIPIAGPFLAAPVTRSYTAAWFTGLLGVAQLAGFTLWAVGGARHRKFKRRQMSFAAAPTRGGGSAALTVRF